MISPLLDNDWPDQAAPAYVLSLFGACDVLLVDAARPWDSPACAPHTFVLGRLPVIFANIDVTPFVAAVAVASTSGLCEKAVYRQGFE